MGAPCSHQRTWAEKMGRSPFESFYPLSESIRRIRDRPRYAGANMGGIPHSRCRHEVVETRSRRGSNNSPGISRVDDYRHRNRTTHINAAVSRSAHVGPRCDSGDSISGGSSRHQRPCATAAFQYSVPCDLRLHRMGWPLVAGPSPGAAPAPEKVAGSH
jgi:hypothetical protein